VYFALLYPHIQYCTTSWVQGVQPHPKTFDLVKIWQNT